MIIFLFTTLSLMAQVPSHWSHILDVRDKHEFYKNDENITKPKNSWQTLFSLVYMNVNLHFIKDCIYLRVPGSEPGVLKVKSIPYQSKCEDYLLYTGEIERTGIKTVLFKFLEKEASLDFTKTDFKSEKWIIHFQRSNEKTYPMMNLSSAEFKSPKIIFLAPKSLIKINSRPPLLKTGDICHDVKEDCEATPSVCSQCNQGWYELPNGCAEGPKYCGSLDCGKKNGPACRRGIKWQKSDEEFDCARNSSFAYCSNGLIIDCEGRKAFCR
jgi:hypothetical protein